MLSVKAILSVIKDVKIYYSYIDNAIKKLEVKTAQALPKYSVTIKNLILFFFS